MPMPPSLASAIAISDSVTVSIAALIIGIFNAIPFVNFVLNEVSFGRISEYLGIRRTSSKVIPSLTIL